MHGGISCILERRFQQLFFGHELSIAIPASLVSDIPHLREKTSRIGTIGRAAAIFGVDEVVIFPDSYAKNQSREIDLIATILSYLETPQYLRKRLFKIRPELKYAGVLPPLRTPHHPLPKRAKDLVTGEYREGVTVSHVKEGTIVDVGVERHALIRSKKLPKNVRVTVRIRKTKRRLEAEIVSRNEISEYWGYQITCYSRTLGKLLQRQTYDLILATSRNGKPFQGILEELTSRWGTSHKILIVFGAPAQGLYEIVKREGLKLDEITDFVANTIPHQKVETVRTEEALLVTLGILNLMATKG
ncbi:MAG: RNA-binding protein [Candidatus Bathyarchaeota archaeon]|nr:MAG: RNA-binding protein [Candidatus Bathyarchaeota archaeon]